MSDTTAPLVVQLSDVADQVFDNWDKGMKSGKLLTALAGRVERYDPRVTAIRAALSKATPTPTQGRVLGPYEHSPQIGVPGSCVMAQVALHGMAIATFDPTPDPSVATHRAHLCAEALNRAAEEVA